VEESRVQPGQLGFFNTEEVIEPEPTREVMPNKYHTNKHDGEGKKSDRVRRGEKSFRRGKIKKGPEQKRM